MRIIAQVDNECFIACGDKVIAVNFSNNEKSIREFLYSKTDGHVIITLTVSGGYIFAGYSNKHVCCWDVVSGEFLGSGVFKKRPTAIAYSSFERHGTLYKAILVSDKTGEVWGSDVPLMKNLTILAGHTASIITDMTMHNDLVVTADRDEKIRISRFPDLETIISYCFHHTSVVSSVNFIDVNGASLLLSTSWDHRLCIWNPSQGKLLDSRQYFTENVIDVPTEEIITNDTTTIQQQTDSVTADQSTIEEGGDEDEVIEKTYDESSAGHYPCKVVTTNIKDIAVAAVIFKNGCSLSLHRVTNSGSSGSNSSSESNSNSVQISEGKDIELSAIPSDIIFNNSDLIVLLPSPHIMAVYRISIEGDTINSVECTSQYKGVKDFQGKCNEAGVTFSQFVDHIDADGSEEKGMKKHLLDKPFDKEVNINYQAKRGAKRSRKL